MYKEFFCLQKTERDHLYDSTFYRDITVVSGVKMKETSGRIAIRDTKLYLFFFNVTLVMGTIRGLVNLTRVIYVAHITQKCLVFPLKCLLQMPECVDVCC